MVRSQYPKPKDRILILGEDVNQVSVRDLIRAIYDINLDDEEKEQTFQEYERPPIHLLLNTFGGSVYDGLGLIGAIELSTTPVVVTCLGSAMSMGLFILAAGHHRRAHHLSTIMYHQISLMSFDKLEGFKKDAEEAQRLEKLCDAILFKRTKLKSKDLEDHKMRKSDWFMSAQDALKAGIIDEIIGAPLISQENAQEMEDMVKKIARKKATKKAPAKSPGKTSKR
jgi:ATP-dependent Clp protease protease subunit